MDYDGLDEDDLCQLGDVALNRGDYTKALECYTNLLNQYPTDCFILARIAQVNLKTGDFEKAKIVFLKILGIDPDHVPSWTNLGLTYTQLGETDNAIEAFARSLKIYPRNRYAWDRLGNLFESGQYLPEALFCYQNVRGAPFEEAEKRVRELESQKIPPKIPVLVEKYQIPGINYYALPQEIPNESEIVVAPPPIQKVNPIIHAEVVAALLKVKEIQENPEEAKKMPKRARQVTKKRSRAKKLSEDERAQMVEEPRASRRYEEKFAAAPALLASPDIATREKGVLSLGGSAAALELMLAGDLYLTVGEHAQTHIVCHFIQYLEENELNRRHHYALVGLFLGAVARYYPVEVSPRTIARWFRQIEDHWRGMGVKEGDEEDYEMEDRDRAENNLLCHLDEHDPRRVLEAMKSIFAFLTPGSLIKTKILPAGKKAAKKRTKKPARSA